MKLLLQQHGLNPDCVTTEIRMEDGTDYQCITRLNLAALYDLVSSFPRSSQQIEAHLFYVLIVGFSVIAFF